MLTSDINYTDYMTFDYFQHFRISTLASVMLAPPPPSPILSSFLVFPPFPKRLAFFGHVDGGDNASINSSGAHPPPGNRGAFAYVVSPGGWALA